MYETVAVPLDGSRVSELAIPYAASIAKRSGGQVHLLHVIGGAGGVLPELGGLDTRNRRETQVYLDGLAAQIHRQTGVEASGTLLDGGIVDALRKCADEIGAELVVMTTHGRGGLQRAWLGSVADRFVRTSERPVLLVPAEADRDLDLKQLPELRDVLVTLDGSKIAEEILVPALGLADGEPITFHLVRVATLPPMSGVYGTTGYAMHLVDEERQLRRDRQREAAEYLNALRPRLESPTSRMVPEVLFSNEPASAILEHARAREVDLIAIATRGRGGVSRMVFGSVADKVIRADSPPVLVYRPRTEVAVPEEEAAGVPA